MDGLRDAEGAPIGDTARRLVRSDPIHLNEGTLEGVRAGDDGEQTSGVLGGLGACVRVSFVLEYANLEGSQLAVLGPHLRRHVVITAEGIRCQVVGSILNPFDRLPRGQSRHDGAHVPWVHVHLAAESASDVRGDEANLVLWQLGDEGEHGSDGVGGLRGDPEGQLPGDLVHLGDATARLDGRHVEAREVDVLLDHGIRLLESLLCASLIPDLPVPVMIRLLLPVLPQDGGVRLQCLLRVDDHWQGLVVHVHGLYPVSCGIAALGDDRCHLLTLEQDQVGRQDHLLVRHEGRDPGQARGLQILSGNDGQNPGDLQGLRGVEGGDSGVCIRAPDDVQPQHTWQVDVFDVVPLSTDETGVLLSLD